MAQLKNQGLEQTISDLARRCLTPAANPVVDVRDGIPIWVDGPGTIPVTSEIVRDLTDEA